MARPIKNNLDYYPHENCMRNDKKLLAIRCKFDNMIGYGLYNCMLEALSEEDLLQIPYNEKSIALLAGDFRVDEVLLKSFIEYAISIDCFQIVEGYLRCEQLEKRGKIVFEKRGRSLLQLRVSEAEMPVVEGFLKQKLPEIGVLDSESTQRKEKKRKEKKSIKTISDSESESGKTKYLDWVFLSEAEYKKLLSQLGYKFLNRCIEKLDSYIENNEKGRKYKNHYKVMIQWVINSVADEGLKPEPVDLTKQAEVAQIQTKISRAEQEAMEEAKARKKELMEESTAPINLSQFTKNIGRSI